MRSCVAGCAPFISTAPDLPWLLFMLLAFPSGTRQARVK
jgi:hypothetical protein